MVATIVLVVSNKPIQSSMNNTSSDSKVTMRVDETSMADESMAHGAGAMRICMHGICIYGGEILKYRRKRST